jgi:3-hydroxyacyl-[acyl-carrier-protein] dehydratase
VTVREYIIDPATVDCGVVVADIEEIRRYNRQRFEMEQLTAIVLLDPDRVLGVGYKDVGMDEFWVRGHMPGTPLMPGVIMCEIGAQMCSFVGHRLDLFENGSLGFAGLENVRFRGPVRPGDRLLMACQMSRIRPRRMVVCEFQGTVGMNIVCEGQIKGVPLPLDQMRG